MPNNVNENRLKKGPLKKKRNNVIMFIYKFVREQPLGTIGAAITLVLLFISFFSDFAAPYGMNEQFTANLMEPPSARFWLGTDNLGRDLLSRLIYGARVSMIIGLAGATVSLFVGTIIGTLSGYIVGKFDLIVQRFVDAALCIPGLVLLMVVISLIGRGFLPLIISIGVLAGISESRVIRSAVMKLKEDMYIQAAKAIGCSSTKIIIRHILPHIMAPLIILFSTRVPLVILIEATLSFLGFGIPPPQPSWGGMLTGSARNYMFQAPWMVIWPGLAVSISVFGINLLGDAVRDVLDPRLRTGVGKRKMKKIVKANRKKKG